jgi:hypothetical protein
MNRMTRGAGVLCLVVMGSLLTGCEDQVARKRVYEVVDSLKIYTLRVETWAGRVHDGLCNLEESVFRSGVQSINPNDAYCVGGPPPPEPPDPLEDPWAEPCDENGEPEGCWEEREN